MASKAVKRAAVVRGLTAPRRAEPVEMRRRLRRRWVITIAVCWAVSALACGWGYATIRQVWPINSMDDFVMYVTTPVAVPLLWILVVEMSFASLMLDGIETQEGMLQVRPIRQAAIDANDELAPAVESQPLSLTVDDLASSPSEWGPLNRPPNSGVTAMLTTAGVMLVFGVTSLLVALSYGLDTETFAIGGSISAGVIALGTIMVARGLVIRKALPVSADDWGLRWKERHWWGSSTKTLAWHEIRAFMVVTLDSTELGLLAPVWPHRMYVLDAQSAVLAWIAPDSRYRAEYPAHERFLRLVATRVRLPLRDPSAAIQQLNPAPATRVPGRANQQRTSTQGSPTQYATLSPDGRRTRSRPVMVVPVAFYLILIVGAWELMTH